MKLNLGPFTPSQIGLGLKPITGLEALVYFSREVCQRFGYVRATGAASGSFTSEGGAALPTAGRTLVARVVGNGAAGAGGTMTVTFNVKLFGDVTDTVTASFDIPTWAAIQDNFMPFGAARDFIPDTPANVALPVIEIVSFDSVAKMTAGNVIEIFSVPDESSYYEIVGATGKSASMDGPSQIAIPNRYDPQHWTKLSRGQLREVSVGFRSKGSMDQLARFNGREGTLRYDILKEEQVLWERRLFNQFVPNVSGDLGEGDEVLEATASGTFSDALFGYGDAA